MKKSIEEVIEQLKLNYGDELILKEGHKRRNFSLEFKRQILFEVKSNGISVRALTEALGLNESSVRNWKRDLRLQSSGIVKKGVFRRLEFEPEADQRIPAQSPYIEGKSGVRACGLSVKQIAELLRYL